MGRSDGKPKLSEWHPWASHGIQRMIRTEAVDSGSIAMALRRKSGGWRMTVYPPDGREYGGDYFDDLDEAKAAADALWAGWEPEPPAEEPGMRALASELARALLDHQHAGVSDRDGALLLKAERAGLMPDNPAPPPDPRGGAR